MTSPGGVKQDGEGRSDPVSGPGRRATVCKPGALRVSKTLSVDADKVAAAMSTRTRSTRTVLGTGITLEAGCADKVRGSRGLDRRHICAQACHVDRPWYLQDAAHSSSMSHALTHAQPTGADSRGIAAHGGDTFAVTNEQGKLLYEHTMPVKHARSSTERHALKLLNVECELDAAMRLMRLMDQHSQDLLEDLSFFERQVCTTAR